jgi:gliding motility-associated-like protein
MKALRLIVLLFSGLMAYGQQNWIWQSGGAANDEALRVTHDEQGNIYSTGYFSQYAAFGPFIITSSGSADLFIAKQDPNGEYQWVKKAGGSQLDKAYSITCDKDGNVIVCGLFSGQATFGTTTITSTSNTQDMFVAKLDASGNFQWAKHFGGNDVDIANSVSCDSRGNVLVTGQFRGAAQFGSYSFISQQSGTALAYDIIVAKLSPNGSVIWAKAGGGKYDDRGLSITSDEKNNVYLSGQFSDTLNFASTYPNNSFNTGLLMKFDSLGNEKWIRKFYGSLVTIYDLKYLKGGLFLTGDFLGMLTVSTTPAVTLSNGFQNKIFAMKIDTAGSVMWKYASGSDQSLSALGISVDTLQNAYITGTFKCVYTDLSGQYGAGVFNSVGFRDVFVTRLNSSGVKVWDRQFGGPGDDHCQGISTFIPGQPVIAGSFESHFNVPDGGQFTLNQTNINLSSQGASQNAGYCGDPGYGQYVSVESKGGKDVFCGDVFSIGRQTYDFYVRSGAGCNKGVIPAFINVNQDTIVSCYPVPLRFVSGTGASGAIGPEYSLTWNTGETSDSIMASTTGWYKASMQYSDQCRSYSDSVYVEITVPPAQPDIMSSTDSIIQAIPVNSCLDKLVSVNGIPVLTAINLTPGYPYEWETPMGTFPNLPSVNATQSGYYHLIIYSPNGLCSMESCVEVHLLSSGPGNGNVPVDPEIQFQDSLFQATDTVRVCLFEAFTTFITDSAGTPLFFDTYVQWTINGGFSFSPFASFPMTLGSHEQTFTALASGPCVLKGYILDPVTLQPMDTLTRLFYLDVMPLPVPNVTITGPAHLCPGDTALITLTGAPSYSVTGPGIVAFSADQDSVWVIKPGLFTADFTITDSITGCSTTSSVSLNLEGPIKPTITMVPASGLICPGDSVKLIADPGTNYDWTGPLSSALSTSQTFWVNSPGMYHYSFVNTEGCELVSEFKEVKEYTTPYLSLEPTAVICPGGELDLVAFTSDSASINWLFPLSGSNMTQTVTSPGVYNCVVSSCGITDTVAIEVLPSTLQAAISPSQHVYICSGSNVTIAANPGMVSYEWMPGNIYSAYIQITQPGVYTVKVTDENGCTSTDSITADTLTPPEPPIVQNKTICTGSSVTLVATGDSVTWYLNSLSSGIIYTGDSLLLNSVAQDTSFVVYNNDTVCKSTPVTVHVYIDPGSVKPVITADTTICIGSTLALSIDTVNNVLYQWNGPLGLQSTNGSILIPVADTLHEGYYSVYAHDTLCTSLTDSVYIRVITPYEPIITISNPCEGGELAIASDTVANVTYSWTNPSGVSLTGYLFQLNSAQLQDSGMYVLNYVDQGCSASKQVQVNVYPVPAAPVILGDQTYCSGHNIVLNTPASASINHTWTDLPGNSYPGDTLVLLASDTTFTGFYTLIAEANGCTSSDSVLISVFNTPAILISAVTDLCKGDEFTVESFGQASVYSWTGPSGFQSSQQNFSINSVVSGHSGYYYLDAANNNCSRRDSILVTVTEPPVFSLGNDTTICLNTTTVINAPQGYTDYLWQDGSTGSSFTASEAGTVTVTITVGAGCTSTDSMMVYTDACDTDGPNVFTPNGDGNNDAFFISNPQARSMEVTLLNRWGKVVKTLSGVEALWNGDDYEGKDLPTGVYYYSATVVDHYGETKVFNGFVQLLR